MSNFFALRELTIWGAKQGGHLARLRSAASDAACSNLTAKGFTLLPL